MRNLVITENITIDGVIDATAGWFAPGNDTTTDLSDLNAVMTDYMKQQDAIVLGRTTFEEMRGYWPLQTSDTTGIHDHLNNVAKYVVSSTLQDPKWDNTTILRNGIEDVKVLKRQQGGEICLTGSVSLAQGLIGAGLVDEYRLFVYPTVQGTNGHLFEKVNDAFNLKLVETQPFTSGVTLLRYIAS